MTRDLEIVEKIKTREGKVKLSWYFIITFVLLDSEIYNQDINDKELTWEICLQNRLAEQFTFET